MGRSRSDAAALPEREHGEHGETIAAISTPPGRGGIGIVRISGPGARRIAIQLVRLAGELPVRRPQRAKVLHPGGLGGTALGDAGGHAGRNATDDAIDDALVTFFRAPHSYTGEDVVEIAAHGSPVVLQAIVAGAVRRGARLARAGEFTERAFLSGRLNLVEAEAVSDLIAAKTLEQARTSASQLGGAISRRVAPAKESLLHLIALLEAGMDFASGELDDVDVVPPSAIDTAIRGALRPLEALAGSFRGGLLLRSGAALALVGRPNAGKSSLFNRLLMRERAIVTPLPGTTRDTVEETFSLAGIPLRLVDTAGLRLAGEAPADAAEAEGIARSREALADADVVLMVFDGSMTLTREELDLAGSLGSRPHALVLNKADLLGEEEVSAAVAAVRGGGAGGNGGSEIGSPTRVIATSATTGRGIEELKEAILRELDAPAALGETGALNTSRQHEEVLTAVAGLRAAAVANLGGLPHEVLLLDLYAALRALDELTGETTTEEILGRIFSSFCIGK